MIHLFRTSSSVSSLGWLLQRSTSGFLQTYENYVGAYNRGVSFLYDEKGLYLEAELVMEQADFD